MPAGPLDKASRALAGNTCAARHRGSTLAEFTRFGERLKDQTGASFRCAAWGEVAAAVRLVRKETAVDMGPPLGRQAHRADGVVIDYFLGSTAWRATDQARYAELERLLTGDRPDPAALRRVDGELAPFHCRGCELNYCSSDWTTNVVMDGPFYDCTEGTCPRGHRQTVDD